MQGGVVLEHGTRVSWAYSFIVMLALLGFLRPAASIADDYLSELEAEAESSAAGAVEGGELSVGRGAIGSAKRVPAERASFERILELERPHVYTFYRRLSDAEKMQVVTRFNQGAKSISKAANQVLDLYFQKK